jgi:hypothetical protein
VPSRTGLSPLPLLSAIVSAATSCGISCSKAIVLRQTVRAVRFVQAGEGFPVTMAMLERLLRLGQVHVSGFFGARALAVGT